MRRLSVVLLFCLLLAACTAQPAETPSATIYQSTIPTVPEIHNNEVATGSSSEIAPEIMRFNVYTPNENYDGFVATEVEGAALSLPDELVKAGVLTEDVQINYVRWDSDNTTVTVDLNSAFRDLINSQGSAGEYMLMGCVVNTFLSAYEADQVYITVDGQTLESGHVIYDYPMEYYE